MTDDFKHKPPTNTILTLLSALNLLAIMISVAAMPITMFSTKTVAYNPLYPIGVSNTQLIASVPFVAVIFVILAWLVHSNGKPKAAKMLAATPLFWGMAVFLMMLPAIG